MVVLRGSGGAGWEGFYSREEGGGGVQATRSRRRLLIVLTVCNIIGKVNSKVKD